MTGVNDDDDKNFKEEPEIQVLSDDDSDEEQVKDGDLGTEYLVRPVGRAEDEEDASDFEPEENGVEEDIDEGEDDENDNSGGAGKSEAPPKRKRAPEEDEEDSGDEDDDRPPKR
ncbi:unnamed protein product [Arabidopsis thaliana]|uniref:(thale cress) hypothetical protein n=1 Tax=Arabidopsis thaliana TaxID=3702 RepID=A0A7G2DW62_ARATH|nr:unnamed protein product [Arabidopsis thaliana]